MAGAERMPCRDAGCCSVCRGQLLSRSRPAGETRSPGRGAPCSESGGRLHRRAGPPECRSSGTRRADGEPGSRLSRGARPARPFSPSGMAMARAHRRVLHVRGRRSGPGPPTLPSAATAHVNAGSPGPNGLAFTPPRHRIPELAQRCRAARRGGSKGRRDCPRASRLGWPRAGARRGPRSFPAAWARAADSLGAPKERGAGAAVSRLPRLPAARRGLGALAASARSGCQADPRAAGGGRGPEASILFASRRPSALPSRRPVIRPRCAGSARR